MLTWKKILFILLALGVLAILIPPKTYPAPTETHIEIPVPKVDGDKLESKINDYREKHGLSKLPQDQNLCTYASKRAEEIKTEWDHVPFHQNRCSGTGYRTCGENLAKDYYTEEATLDGWLASPSHLENIKSNWSATCIKCSDNYCAEEFGV